MTQRKPTHCREWEEHRFHAERLHAPVSTPLPCVRGCRQLQKYRSANQAPMPPRPCFYSFQLFGLAFLGMGFCEVWRNGPWQCFLTAKIPFLFFPLQPFMWWNYFDIDNKMQLPPRAEQERTKMNSGAKLRHLPWKHQAECMPLIFPIATEPSYLVCRCQMH